MFKISTIASLMVKIGSDTNGLVTGFQRAETGSKMLLAGVAVVGAGIAAFGENLLLPPGNSKQQRLHLTQC